MSNKLILILDCIIILIGLLTIFKNSKNLKILSTPHIDNKNITNKEAYIIHNKKRLIIVGVIFILMGLLDLLFLGRFNLLIYPCGFIAAFINFTYFDYKSQRYLKNKD
jgi:hypothetical protein